MSAVYTSPLVAKFGDAPWAVPMNSEKLFMTSLFADAKIIVKSADGQRTLTTFEVHRPIVCRQRFFWNRMCAGVPKSTLPCVEIQEDWVDVVLIAMEFFYTRHYNVKRIIEDISWSKDAARDFHLAVYAMADKYDFSELRQVSMHEYHDITGGYDLDPKRFFKDQAILMARNASLDILNGPIPPPVFNIHYGQFYGSSIGVDVHLVANPLAKLYAQPDDWKNPDIWQMTVPAHRALLYMHSGYLTKLFVKFPDRDRLVVELEPASLKFLVKFMYLLDYQDEDLRDSDEAVNRSEWADSDEIHDEHLLEPCKGRAGNCKAEIDLERRLLQHLWAYWGCLKLGMSRLSAIAILKFVCVAEKVTHLHVLDKLSIIHYRQRHLCGVEMCYALSRIWRYQCTHNRASEDVIANRLQALNSRLLQDFRYPRQDWEMEYALSPLWRYECTYEKASKDFTGNRLRAIDSRFVEDSRHPDPEWEKMMYGIRGRIR